jgi:hypothetical protein
MSPPKTWDEFLGGNVLVITKDKTSTSYIRTEKRLHDAGFKSIQPIVKPIIKDISTDWNKLFAGKPPRFNINDIAFMDTTNYPQKQESTVAHFSAYQYIVDKKYDFAFVVEDDIVFHKDWELLAPKYFEVTPPDYELCYIGHHCGCGIDAHVIRVPTFSLQSVLVTKEGAEYLMNKVLLHPAGVCTLDCMINELMMAALVNQEEGTDGISNDFCNWYAWNAEMFPDTTAQKVYEHAQKDVGLIFKEDQMRIIINS